MEGGKKVLPRSLFISHGGGPLPLLGDAHHREMVTSLQTIASDIPRPDAIIVVSAHWEEPVPTITAAQNPPLIYDYYGFPPESYEIQYPCPGDPGLAAEVYRLLVNNNIEARLDQARGLDHGAFVPLKVMYPEADIPCIQLSLVDTLDAEQHILVGEALRDLSEGNVLILGSGFTFHNMKAFFEPENDEAIGLNHAFEDWLESACRSGEYSENERRKILTNWDEAPGARYCHPREEHLLPLHVCYGVAGSACARHISLTILNKKSSIYMW